MSYVNDKPYCSHYVRVRNNILKTNTNLKPSSQAVSGLALSGPGYEIH